MKRLIATALLLCLPLSTLAHEFVLDKLHIIHPSMPGSSVGATQTPVYMVLSNQGSKDERLLGIQTTLGPVQFQRPPAASGKRQALAWIDIPAGQIVVLARNQLRGLITNPGRPVMPGGEVQGTMLFENRGRFDMFFMVDDVQAPEPDMSSAKPGSMASSTGIAAAAGDVPRVASALRKAIETPGAMVAPVVVDGNVAVAGFHASDRSALAFLRRGPGKNWQVQMWSNHSLMLVSSLTGLGVPRSQATRLRAGVDDQLFALGSDYRTRIASFPGTVHVPVTRPSGSAGDAKPAVALASQKAIAKANNTIKISGTFIRATPPGSRVGSAYLTIKNTGNNADRLLRVSASVGRETLIHDLYEAGGVMRMREMPDGLPIAAGQSVTLAPGGKHLMIEGLTDRLSQGQRLTIALEFERAGVVTVPFEVLAMDAAWPPQ